MKSGLAMFIVANKQGSPSIKTTVIVLIDITALQLYMKTVSRSTFSCALSPDVVDFPTFLHSLAIER